MTATQHPDAELLAELGPLAAVISDKVNSVPVRLGPGGTDALVSEITIAVAVYCGRHVLPADALALANPPWPTDSEWAVESQWRDGKWRHHGRAHSVRNDAREQYDDSVRRNGDRQRYRIVRATTTFVTEAEHTPEEQS
ncbi:hypothetical protein [Streptomyces sp. bgisy034]|uniref:hypothetical protein n=1 Tax=Streptomyces sp. bgisy034 TaxID=3413774 RepID=UPI003EBB7051